MESSNKRLSYTVARLFERLLINNRRGGLADDKSVERTFSGFTSQSVDWAAPKPDLSALLQVVDEKGDQVCTRKYMGSRAFWT